MNNTVQWLCNVTIFDVTEILITLTVCLTRKKLVPYNKFEKTTSSGKNCVVLFSTATTNSGEKRNSNINQEICTTSSNFLILYVRISPHPEN